MVKELSSLGVPEKYAGDLWTALLFIAVSVILIVLVKRRNLTALLLSLYAAYSITAVADFKFLSEPNVKALFFAVVSAGVFFLLKQVIHAQISGKMVIVFSLTIVAMVVSIVLNWLDDEAKKLFTPLVMKIFVSPEAKVVWMMVPLLFLSLLKVKKNILNM